MTQTFKAGDTPRIEAQLTKERDGEDEPIDLEAAEAVYFFMEYVETSDLVSDAEAVIEDESQGEVSYVLDQSQAIEPGEYRAEFVIEWEEDSEVDRRKTWPYDSYIELEAVEAVNREGELEVLLVEQEIDSLTVVNDLTASSATIDDLEAVTARLDRLEQDLDADGFNVTGVGELESASHTTEQATITDSSKVTINVPSDESTLSDAIDAAKELYRPAGTEVEINIESGHDLLDSVNLFRSDLRHVTITSEDAEVGLDGSFPDDTVFIVNRNSFGPTWDILLDGGGHGKIGLEVIRNSFIYITDGSGVKNCTTGLNMFRCAFARAQNGVFTGNSNRGISVVQASGIHADSVDVSENGSENVRVGGSSVANVSNATATGAGSYGVRASGGAMVRADGIDVSDATDNGIEVNNTAMVSMDTATANNCGKAIEAEHGAYVCARALTVTGSNVRAVESKRGSKIDLDNVSITGTNSQLFASRAGTINVTGEVSGGGIDITVRWGGIMSVDGTETSNSSEGDPHEDDMNIPPNTIQGEGIIFAETTEAS